VRTESNKYLFHIDGAAVDGADVGNFVGTNELFELFVSSIGVKVGI